MGFKLSPCFNALTSGLFSQSFNPLSKTQKTRSAFSVLCPILNSFSATWDRRVIVGWSWVGTVCLEVYGNASVSGPYRESLTGWNPRNPVRPQYVKHRRRATPA